MQNKEFKKIIAGKEITISINNLAERADASVIVRCRDTVVLVTAVMGNSPKDADFFPLTVDFEEKFYASGKILGSKYQRREGKPSDEAILSGRIIDRTIRPLFEQWIRHEVQVVATVLSMGHDDPDMLALLGASVALATSRIPWKGPVGGVRIIKDSNNTAIVNPSFEEREAAIAELFCCGHNNLVNMIEFSGNELKEADSYELIEQSMQYINEVIDFQKEIIAECGKEKRVLKAPELSAAATNIFNEKIAPKLEAAIFTNTPGDQKVRELADEWLSLIGEESEDVAAQYFEEIVTNMVQENAVEKKRRADGREIHQIRPLYAQAGGISPSLHGSGIFYRGQTHIISVLTLGAPGDAQIIEGMEESHKRFMHHYNFPPFSTGEAGRIGGTNRRMIGHGALAEKALFPVIPNKEAFPYTIRLVSEAVSSNGSTSMGSVCAGTLALMDAGVPIKAPVAGISCGRMHVGDKEIILTDIQGPEDHYGDMDFKVAGTQEGITAIQLDVKVPGISLEAVKQTLAQAYEARLKVLDVIRAAIAQPREKISPFAPEIITTRIKAEQIGLVIGPGGKTINGILADTGAIAIDIDEDGTVFITGKNGTGTLALQKIKKLTKEFAAGEKYEGTITRITDFGAFAEIDGGEGLIHVSEFAPFRVNKPDELVKVGMKVPVVVKEIDEKKRINLSIKQANPDFFKKPAA